MKKHTFQTSFCSFRTGLAIALLAMTVFAVVEPAKADEPGKPEFPVVVPAPAAPTPPVPITPEPEEAYDNDFHWMILGGVGYRPDYEGSDQYDPHPLGSVKLWWNDGRKVELTSSQSSGAAVRLSSQVIPNSWLKFGPVLQYRLPRGHVTTNQVNNMKNIDGALEGGAYLGVGEGPWSVGGTYTYDFTGDYSGHLVELAAGWKDQLSDVVDMGLTVASTWASEDYLETYFNVSPADSARSGLTAYDANHLGGGFKDVGTRVTMGFGPSSWDGWKIIATGAYFRLIGEASDSPVVNDVGDENQFFGGLGVAYEH